MSILKLFLDTFFSFIGKGGNYYLPLNENITVLDLQKNNSEKEKMLIVI